MIITHVKLNHLVNPLGFDLEHPTVSYVVEEARGKKQAWARVEVSLSEDFSQVLYDTGEREDIVSTGFEIPLELNPQTRYFYRVTVMDDAGDSATSSVQWFETSKAVGREEAPWSALWITPAADKKLQMAVYKEFAIEKPVAKARAYGVGLGLYELYINGKKQGEECLLPGFCDYDTWIGYQTYELSLTPGSLKVEMVLGDGWYKGWYGLRQNHENYGDALAALLEIHLWYEDGTTEVLGTDATWKARRSKVTESGIYPGEVYDASLDISEVFDTKEIDLGYGRLCPRLSAPILVQEKIKPIEVIKSPKGETILDMGQNMVGWITFKCAAPAGTKIRLQMGEILQDGCFYNDNLRTAKSEFTYISDGQERLVREHFTFHGFRFVKIEGWAGEVSLEDFEGWVIHSQMEEIGDVKTSDSLVNQLVHNARWGMKGNFLDVPTDCPQRDERYGWTGDAQIFSGTACYFMDTYAFYTKYGRDVYAEQCKLDGSVPDVVPVCNYPGDASTAWGDAATVIPWNVYLHFGDKSILFRQYDSMKAWVEYMFREDEKDGGKRLWLTGTHYGDWLALDGSVEGGVFGATDPGFVASSYYYYSTTILAKSAAVLEYEEDASYYKTLSREIKEAFIREYFTPTGRLSIDTMTAYVLSLSLGLYPENGRERCQRGLLQRLKKKCYHLDTGFVGTPWLCRVLSNNGMNDLAYHLLLEKGFPGWLYEVLMGATTVWERWNSVTPDGKISGTEMNSLNHYSYGAIVEWMFRDMVGIVPSEEGAGFKRFILCPKPDYQMDWAKGSLASSAGLITSSWERKADRLSFTFTVPFDSEARIILPDARLGDIKEIWEKAGYGSFDGEQEGTGVAFTALAGSYAFDYEPTRPYRKEYTLDSPFEELKENPKTRAILEAEYPPYADGHIPFEKELHTLEELTWGPFTCVSQEQREKIDRLLRQVED